MTLGLVDIGIGNLGSLSGALNKINAKFKICNSISAFNDIDKIILPGVGNFRKFMHVLKQSKFDEIILKKINQNTPILGICLGFQILFESSNEDGFTNGLGILNGNFDHFNNISKSIRVPHTGWNQCYIKNKNKLYENIGNGFDFYFSHKYYLKNFDNDIVITNTNYHVNFVTSVNKDNIYGVQFHPEKSQYNGLKILENFAFRC